MEYRKEYITHVVQTYSNMIYRIAYQNLQVKSDAEDVVQEVLLKLMKEPAFTEEEHLKAWLIRVTVNHCHNLTRYYYRRQTEPLTDAIPDADAEEQGLWEQLFRLPVKDRDVIYLYYYEGYNTREIGQLLHMSEHTVSSRLRRARKKLKVILEEGENLYDR